GKYILNGLITKFLLRRVLQSQMPPRVLHQMARSRDVLFRRWIDVDLRELILDTLSAARALSTTIFSRREVAKLLSRHESGESKVWPLLWSLLVLELWYLNQRTQTVRVTSYPGEQHRTDGIR
ncbi:MAG TPA: asparagine synthase-related protein, partial [bacterium]|nr:asparagine synthase-related protein [bacterium]